MLISRQLIEKTQDGLKADPGELSGLKTLIRDSNPRQLEPAERLHQRFLLHRAASENPREARIEFERIINGNDLTSINYLEKGLWAAKSVGRIHVRDTSRQTIAYGTGFLTAPRVLMTNNHVLPKDWVAGVSAVEFEYEYDVNGADRVTYFYSLQPEQLFFTSEDLDFTVVAVAPSSEDEPRPLADYSWLKLIADPGKALLGEYLTIIQHPGGQRKQVCVRENQLIKVDPKVVWYATDTLGGSSGSPVFNNSWQVVALHHLGVPAKDENGNWLTIDGQIWDESVDESRIKWIANEGIRISQIMGLLRQELGDHPLVQPMFDESHPKPPVLRPGAQPEIRRSRGGYVATPDKEAGKRLIALSPASRISEANSVTLSVPLEITVRVGAVPAGPRVEVGAGEEPARRPLLSKPATPEEKLSIDPDYSNREGFDEAFLGEGNLATPLPRLSPKLMKDAALLLLPEDDNRFVIHYHHFSVLMNAKRGVAFFTAVNIDGELARKIEREKDFWFPDPRIAASAQTDDHLYENNPLDRGHLVRRLDPAWGASQKIAKVANDDTFHFTNCSPQHKELNQRTWAGLEDYILNNASSQKFRVNVFTGPVFAKNDPVYRGVGLPKQFWKVAAMVKQDGTLSATAYMLSQAKLLQDLEEVEFVFSAYKTYQVPIRRIEKLTGLSFGELSKFDPLHEAVEATAVRELQFFDDIKF